MERISLAATVGTAGLVRSTEYLERPRLPSCLVSGGVWPLEGSRRGIYGSRHLMLIGADAWSNPRTLVKTVYSVLWTEYS